MPFEPDRTEVIPDGAGHNSVQPSDYRADCLSQAPERELLDPGRRTWHQLPDTLLSSQRTSAHRSGTFVPSRGNFSTLALRSLPVKLALLGVSGGSEAFQAPSAHSYDRQLILPIRSDPGGLPVGTSQRVLPRCPVLPVPATDRNITGGRALRQIRGA